MVDFIIINAAIDEYFQKSNAAICKPKDLMPIFIKRGVFQSDNQKGNPFRKLLRLLHKKNQLEQIPSVLVEKKNKNCYWWIVNLKKNEKKQLPTSLHP